MGRRRLLPVLSWTYPSFSTLLSSLLLFQRIICEDLTEIVPTLTSLGSLVPFTPPADCFTTSLWRSSKFFDDSNQSGVFQTRFFTRWYVGCNVDLDSGEPNTCCPPRYNTWGFYAPGACPQGYSTVPNNAVNPWVGDQRGTVCCPIVRDPSTILLTAAAFATAYVNPLDRDPISISCFEWASSSTSKSIVYQGNFNARAIVVFGSQLTSVTFRFAQAVDGLSTQQPPTSPVSSGAAESTVDSDPKSSSTTAEENPSPGSTTSSGAIETGPGDYKTASSSTPTSLDDASATDSSASASQNQSGEGGGRTGLSGGAIAGIAIGVSIPVIAVAAFVAYRLGRRGNDVPIVPIYNDPRPKEGEGQPYVYNYHAGPNTNVQDRWS
ncbi:hypothetical protein TWF696_001160 [Orbilia brochopaga]|uniref:Uncharacterized protein n=1 Tax=Orbilia brochopaga TaxID=3140254 RepID=A0AAV9VFZ2_9PEZI